MPKFPHPAATTHGLRDQAFGALAARAAGHAGKLHALHIGDTHRAPPPSVLQALQGVESRAFQNSPVQGEPSLLDAIETKLRAQRGACSRADLQVVSGATSGLTVAANAILSPGDEVLLPSPYWPLIRGIVRARGGIPVEVPFFAREGVIANDFLTRLENAITPQTTAIYWNTPHNPTGTIFDESYNAAIADIARRHQLWILADEVYDELHFAERTPAHISTFADAAERTISVYSVSKIIGLAGARVGYVYGPRIAMDAVRAVQTYITYCAAKTMQHAATAALRDGATWLAENRMEQKAAAKQMALRWCRPVPEGGTFLFLPVPIRFRSAHPNLHGQDLTDAFLDVCLQRGVILTPGASCGMDYHEWVRACFTVVPRNELEDAINALQDWFQ